MAKFIPITEEAFRKGEGKKVGPHAVSAHFDAAHHRIVLHLDTGIDLSFDPRHAFGLEHATAEELSHLTLEGVGGTLHLPKLDTFMSIPRILEGFLGPMDWARREAAAQASRENGKLGGRPRKPIAATA